MSQMNADKVKEFYNQKYQTEDFVRFPLAEKHYIQSLIKRYNIKSNSEILDIGCGTGKYSSLFKSCGMNTLGVDISKTAVNKAKELYPNCSFQVGNILNYKSEKKYDVIFASGLSLFNTEKLELLYPFMDHILHFLKADGKFVFLKTSSLTDSYSKNKTRINYKIDTFENFFKGVKKTYLLETSATYPHSFIIFGSLGFSKSISSLSQLNTRLTGIPVRVQIVLQKDHI